MSTPDTPRIAVPRPPAPTPPFRLPVVASLAPLVAAVALWLMTGSPFALLFAVLGPITAVASFADSRIGARRSTTRELARFVHDAAGVRRAIGAAHDAERSDLAEAGPCAEVIASRHGADPYRWSASATSPILTRIGVGTVPSSLRLDASVRTASTLVDSDLDEIERSAAVITDAPVLVDARLGIGVCGSPPLAAAVTRAIIVQLAWVLSPADHWVAAARAESLWTDALPHHPRREARAGYSAEFGINGDDRAIAVIALARTQSELPGECRIVVRVGHDTVTEIVQHPDRAQRRPLTPGMLSRESAMSWAARATVEAARDGLISPRTDLPALVSLTSLLPAAGHLESSATLAARFAADAEGPVTIDLVSHGPHAVVGGTTGSGKSELLISWVLALAARHSPAQVNFLLMDFKGGSAFDSLAALPHSVGIITDLDAAAAARALSSLRAELKYRERKLAEAGVRDIRDLPLAGLPGMARLVIVADEFAAMLADHPDLHPLFADIAARGRSLGVHLILCTQRPAGIVRDGVLANADLRISLRVNNGADSAAVVGSSVAAELPHHAVGRGVIAIAGGAARCVQFAIAEPSVIAAIAHSWSGAETPRRPWCDPLPTVLRLREVADAGASRGEKRVSFGLIDVPHEQRRAIAQWDPHSDGHVLVLGAARSGTSTALRAVARGGLLVPTDVPGAWDAIAGLESAADLVVAIDDLDSLLARFPPDYRDIFLERLSRLLRDGPARGIALVLVAQRLTADLNSLAPIIPARLMLRHANRSEFVLAGGDGAMFDGALPQGGGTWRGARVQVVCDPDPLREYSASAPAPPSRLRPWAIVTSRASRVGTQLASCGLDVLELSMLPAGEWESMLQGGQAVVGDVEQWQSRWGLLPALRSSAEIMFDRCTIADYRSLTRSREVPPPLIGLTDAVWLEGDEGVLRATLPSPQQHPLS
ncbi:FtsK/SpoIIIE domain-containing protein [Salinibacterium sp. G-O1]|uniref:FtsK/SpoIIIE domain-containing protein n=1 Tax=Salinibacterium sp. G-O1 TaxID=3046208 RepID=UPI0024BAC2CE|nr:FtsK/SpoIIIE domain-containing protein [Salinibacterium sp. G-O1]MDJ0334707.1 FtsK/SpoIIIE domain-containing protein [Salinibacterium sp. G-O1]